MTAPGVATHRPLVARTVELGTDVDLAHVAGQHGVLWEQGGAGFAGRGVAASITAAATRRATVAAEVGEVLSAIRHDAPFPPMAVGALPFSASVEGELVVPEVVVRRRGDGQASLTVTGVDPDPDRLDHLARWVVGPSTERRDRRPTQYQVEAVTDVRGWCERVADAARAVAAGRLAKVVLAREVAVVADRTIPTAAVARRLRTAYPSCMVFAFDGFVGASPELLVARQGQVVRSQPLAGTAPRAGKQESGTASACWMLSSAKERREHQIVVEAVAATLAQFCPRLSVPQTPSLVAVGSIAHLGTAIHGTLRDPAPSALELAVALHPTPAVAGTPTETALAYLAASEGLDRGRYAGPVGWVDAAGDGEWAVGIRSAQIAGSHARLLAGAGIVAESEAEAELTETELKLQPMLNAIVRP